MTENTAPQNQQNEPSTDTAAQPNRKRTGLAIGAGAVAALVLAGGVAYGVTGNSGGDGGTVGTAAAESSGNSGASEASGSDAGTLREVAEPAVSEAGGRGASSIEVEKDGHEVEVELDDGRSADVHVGADGTVRVDPEDEDDDADEADASGQDEPVLDLAALQDAVDAGLSSAGEAGVADGVVESVSASDDRGVAYEVSVQGQDGREVDVDLAEDFSVVATDIDDD